MGWFTHIDNDLLEWQLQHWRWLIESLRNTHDLKRIRLIQPTSADFPVTASSSEERAVRTFQCVQKHFGLETWPCVLVPFEEADDVMKQILPATIRPERTQGAAGLFEITEERKVIIRYKPDHVGDPMALVATMAHEFCHYIIATLEKEPPGGWDEHEPITDLAAVFFGFGIFLANVSFRFTQWQDHRYHGWSASRQGYLSENALSLALALFCACKEVEPNLASQHLATNPRYFFRGYHKELLKKHAARIQEIRRITETSEGQQG